MTLQTLPKYETYKNSGIEWLGEIPVHWNTARFRNAFSFDKGLNITKENLQEHGVLCVSYGEVHSKYGFELNPDKHILKCVSDDYLMSSPKSLLHNGDFIFADTSEDIDGSGNFTQLVSDHQIFAGYHTVIARSVINANKRFLAYALDSVAYRNQIRKRVKGVKVYSITKGLLKDTVIWLPSEAEQAAIAHFLDQKTAQIDAAIAIKEQQIALLKERKQILIQQAATQGLDPTVPMKDSGVEWIGEIPAHWECTEIRKFARTTSGSTPQSGNVNAYYNGNIPWVRTTDLNDDVLIDVPEKITERALRETSCKLIPENSVCVAMYGGSGTIGKHAILRFSGTLNQAVCGIMPSKKISQEYLYYYVKFYRPHWMIVAKGSRVDPNISQDQVKRMPITLPPLKEQDGIVCFIDSECKKISELIDLEYQQIEKLREYKTTLINSAVTGKIKIV